MFSNIVEYEANMDNWQDMQAVKNEITSGSPFSVDAGWIAEVKAQAEFDALNDHVELLPVRDCIECGREIDAFTPPAWAEQGLCSGRCWMSLHGEYEF